MTNTTSAYLTVAANLPKMQAATASAPAVKTASAYYAANIGKVTSIDQFVGNYRLLPTPWTPMGSAIRSIRRR
jgi:hypothetical protein